MGSRERLADTKRSLFAGGAAAVLNVRDDVSRLRAAKLSNPPRWFGFGDAGLPGIHERERGVFLRDRHTLMLAENRDTQTYHLDARLPGDYNLENLAAALAGALELGCEVELLVEAVQHLELPSGRYERSELGNGMHVVFDAYNASMSGMIATLDAFAQEPAARRIAVLSSMAELGPEASQMHVTVGAHAAGLPIDVLLVGGEFAEQLALGALEAGMPESRVVRFENNLDATSWIKEYANRDDIVLLKGSRMYKLEQVLEGLRA